MPPPKLTVLQKLKAVDVAAETRNVRQTVRRWKVYPSTIHKWRKNYEKKPKLKVRSHLEN